MSLDDVDQYDGFHDTVDTLLTPASPTNIVGAATLTLITGGLGLYVYTNYFKPRSYLVNFRFTATAPPKDTQFSTTFPEDTVFTACHTFVARPCDHEAIRQRIFEECVKPKIQELDVADDVEFNLELMDIHVL